jgi:glycosyltransferase involved in cell wall biosynthesis
VITLGEINSLRQQYKTIYSIFPTGILNSKFVYNKKDHLLTRKNFLWLGSSGAIHKGLDILIDVFKKRDDITLTIGGLLQQEKKILNFSNRSNIFDHGHIDIKTDTFLNIVQKCSYIILPSCSEGFSTSISTGMLHGLIPIVMNDTGFNKLSTNAIFLNDYSIEYIDNKLTELSNAIPEDLNSFSKNVYNFAQNNFTSRAFETNFRKIINNILNQVD